MTSTISTHFHRAYGITFDSDFELPELVIADRDARGGEETDTVEIRYGDVPEALPGRDAPKSWVDVDGALCLLIFPRIGRFLVQDGRRIIVQKDEAASLDDLRGFLVGSAIAGIAHQRGLVPLHVSAVLSPDGALAFTGQSGAGKSTLAAHMHHATDWPLISDDVSGLYPSSHGFEIESGVHTVKLWKDALKSLDRTSIGLRRDLTRFDKFHAIDSANFIEGRHPLKQLIVLEWGETLKLTPLNGRRAFEAALNAVYRPELARLCGNRNHVVQTAMALANSIEILELTRPEKVTVESGVSESVRVLLESISRG